MLDSFPLKTTDAEELLAERDDLRERLHRIKQIAESIAYVAPEMADQRRTEIVSSIRRELRAARQA